MATTSRFKQQWYFRYGPIDKSRDSFRVVKLLPAPYSAPVECILSDERVSTLEYHYSALSYTWGDYGSQRWILPNGKPFIVQPNLFEALKGIRKEDKEICLWVDGICINQADTTEHNRQVGLMGDIYRKAKNVRAWLGPAGEESDFVLEFVERDGDRFRREKAGETLEKIPESEEKAFVNAFRALHRRPYWGRAWIKQEIILAKELVFHCGTKSADGLRLLVLTHCLSMHRLNLQEGKREPLEILLKRYGRTGCTDARDRVFSILSIASDTEGLEEAIADYSVKTPALFFALLRFTEPQNIISLATTLHEILGVRRAELVDYWDKVQVPELAQGMEPPEAPTDLENQGIALVSCVKATKKLLQVIKELHLAYVKELESSSGREFTSLCQLMNLKPFLARICQLLDSDYDLKSAEDNQEGNQEDNREESKAEDCQLLRIANPDFFIMAHKTFFRLRFIYIFIKVDDPSSEKGYKLDPIFPNISSEQLKPFMIYPRIILQKRSMPLAEAALSNIVNKLILIKAFGSEVVGPPLEVICCILLELERLSGSRGICVNDCRYVLEAFGYELNLLGNQLAEIRIIQEHGRQDGIGRVMP